VRYHILLHCSSGLQVVEDTSSYLNLPAIEISEHIGRNHMEMCRFTGLNDVEYRKVASALRRMTSSVCSQPKRGEKLSLNKEQKRMLLDSLRFDQIDARQMTIKKAHANTCKWLLKSFEYLDWFDATKLGEHHGFLWIKGNPGTGKSTLMKFALAHARKTMKDRIIISFFFNARGASLEKSTIGTYQSLLLQLLERLPALQCVFDSLGLSTLSINTSHQWSVESLKTLLEQAIQYLGESSTVCFIDALDECEEHQIRDMISFFEHVGELAVSAGIKFQVCFSSRHYPHITIRTGLELVLEGQEGHDQDITNYLDGELKIGYSKVAKQVRIELQEKASGIFMWVVLVVGILNKEHDSGRMHALRRRLREIPGDLHELFCDILTRDSHNRGELVLCVQWVLFAKQPLSPEQLYFAILSGDEPNALSGWDPDEITIDIIKRFILDSSKGLAEITKSKTPTVQFIHESVKDFLLKENGLENIWPGLGSNFQGQSHERLKHCCLNYMSIDVSTHLELSKSLPKASSQEAAALRKSATCAFPFLEYAVRNVLYHADVAAGSDIAQGNFIQTFQLADWVTLDNLFEKHEIRRHTQNVSLLYILAEGNMSNLIRVHPSILSCLEVEDERYGLPLFASLATGSKEAVRTFLEAYAANQSPRSRLHQLCSQYYQNEGRQGNFGRDFKFLNGRTVLSHVAELGDNVLLAFLLETGKDDIDSKDKYGQTPLSWAAQNGHGAVVKLLLETGKVDADSKDTISGRTPLSWAAEKGHEAVVKLLLETGKVDADSKDTYSGRTPLSRAVEKGHGAVVKLLLETGKVDADSKDTYSGRTLLSRAAEKGHGAVVKLLLETGKVDADSKDTYSGRTPLSWAAEKGHGAVVKLLLETGKVDADSKDTISGQTPLSWAARRGHEAMIKLLQL
jgi:ankyrin repeat protein